MRPDLMPRCRYISQRGATSTPAATFYNELDTLLQVPAIWNLCPTIVTSILSHLPLNLIIPIWFTIRVKLNEEQTLFVIFLTKLRVSIWSPKWFAFVPPPLQIHFIEHPMLHRAISLQKGSGNFQSLKQSQWKLSMVKEIVDGHLPHLIIKVNLICRLDHKNVVKLLEAYESRTCVYLVMEL